MVGKWVNGEVEVQATNDLLQSAYGVRKCFCTSRCTEKVQCMLMIWAHFQNTGTVVVPAKPSTLPTAAGLRGSKPQSVKQEHLPAAVINTEHIRNGMGRPGTWLSEVSIPLIKNMYVSVRDMFYFNE